MIRLFTDEDYELNVMKLLPFKCSICGDIFHLQRRYYTYYLKHDSKSTFKYCSKSCSDIGLYTRKKINCNNCGKEFMKEIKEIKKSKSGNHFCSKSCAATYNNTHKKHGTRKSKLENWLEIQLIESYPELEIHFNRKDTINSELDIYIPTLKLAFELNGLFHYEPIFGNDKLQKIQNNDNRKFQACLEQGIELCIIDSSQQKYFKEQTSKKYLDVIINLINVKLLVNQN